MPKIKQIFRIAIGVIAIVIGLYLLLFHDPLTNLLSNSIGHSKAGLGTNHWLHSILGIFYLIGAYFIFSKK